MTSYYHGTRTEIHNTDAPYLDPARSGRLVTENGVEKIVYVKDPDDPNKPHVYVSDDKRTSELFALPTDVKQVAGGHFDGKFPYVVYLEEPRFRGQGYLYTINQDGYRPFQQTANGKFYSEEKIHLSAENVQAVTAQDLFLRPEPLRVFYLTGKIDMDVFGPQHRRAAKEGMNAVQDFLAAQVEAKGLREYDPASLFSGYGALRKSTPQVPETNAPSPRKSGADPDASPTF